jgi:nicotinate-nucleotide--dimethylbenzimidazole phosphoribosyltransferase
MTDATQDATKADWLAIPPRPLDETAEAAARARQNILTKPPGALGELEEIAIRLAAMQGAERPRAEAAWIAVFAGDHGAAEEGVSAFPQAVTAEMVKNFARGGAAVSVLARELGARLEVVNLGTAFPTAGTEGVIEIGLGPGTANLAREAAMTEAQCLRALEAGRDSVRRAAAGGSHIFIGGEMGIGNTTAAAAMACALLGEPPEALTGPGTGLDGAGVARKTEVIRRALALHGAHCGAPFEALRRLGGFEIAALTGAYIACAQTGLPALADGFIATSAALAAERIRPGVSRWFLYAHASAEPGHRRLLEALKARPLLDLGMRLGEGSGAAAAVPLIRLACALHAGMATFAEAAVPEKFS